MSPFLGFFSLTVATTLATGTAAVLWAQFVGRDMSGQETGERGPRSGPDIRTW